MLRQTWQCGVNRRCVPPFFLFTTPYLDTAVVLHSWPEKIKLSLIRFRTCTRKTTEIWQTSCVLNWKRKLMKDTQVFSILGEISGTSTSATSRPKHVYAARWVGMQEGKARLDPNRRKDRSQCALLGVGIPTEVDRCRNLRYSLSRRTSKINDPAVIPI